MRQDMKERYPATDYSDQIARAAAVITDSSFTCNTRFIIDSYIANKANVYAMDYALCGDYNASTHASDLLPLFAHAKTDYYPLVKCVNSATGFIGTIEAKAFALIVQDITAPGMQQYFTDHAIWGDPNHNGGMSTWQLASNENSFSNKAMGTCVGNLMKVEMSFRNNEGPDIETPSKKCDFWSKLAKEIADISGHDVRGRARWCF